MNSVDEQTRDHERRLLNQRAFPRYFVNCPCERGCPVCGLHRASSRGRRGSRRGTVIALLQNPSER
jgi:hypothetical protein